MSASEMVYRCQKSALTYAQRVGFLTAAEVPPADLGQTACPLSFADIDINSEAYVNAAEKILDGKLSFFALENGPLGQPPVWNKDARTHVVSPMLFGKTLNYRNEELVGNIKYVWEPNRHLHLVTIAQAYFLTKEERFFLGLKRQLESWFEQCPYLRGPNWTSSLELGIRLINWSLVWQLIQATDKDLLSRSEHVAFRDRWLTSIYQHAHFIRGFFSRYSSANNHLIGEAAGLFVAATTWPHWEVTREWQETAKNILIQESLLQNFPDGVNCEQTTAYQQFVLDFLVLAGLMGRQNGVPFEEEYWLRIEAMLEFILAIMDSTGNLPMIGDADDGYVVHLSQERLFDPYKSLLATGSVLFKRSDFKDAAKEFDDKSKWLLGRGGEDSFLDMKPTTRLRRKDFTNGGYYVLGNDFGSPEEILIVADAGPLGYKSIAAHGHADALSFTLSLCGQEFLVDPGTYSYHTDEEWRNYFRGTSAHNTIRVDGVDQSVIAGNFMWITHARAKCTAFLTSDDKDQFDAEHDGYQRLPDPVLHQRRLILNKGKRSLTVIDTLRCKGCHFIEQFWHFAEDVSVTQERPLLKATKNGVMLGLKADQKFSQIQVVSGQTSPPLGWISRRFDIKSPATTVSFSAEIAGESSFKTEMFF